MGKTRAYYNENDAFAVAWLRNLISADLIANGEVDERSIADVSSADLAGYDQCHFFAGIGGWSYALRLAGWADNRPVWTGSCPCQPFSNAGKHLGIEDERHLWPTFFKLIKKCKPTTLFGEQVASKDGFEWLAGVRSDLERTGYAVGAADLCAASAGTPQGRSRNFFVADADGWNAITEGIQRSRQYRQRPKDSSSFWQVSRNWVCTDTELRRCEPGLLPLAHGIPSRMAKLRGFGNAIVPQVAEKFVRAFMECKP